MTRCMVYVVCKENGEEGVTFFDEVSVEESGGLSALEAAIHRGSKWYYPLGEAEVPSHVTDPGDLSSAGKNISALVEAWIEQGAPIFKGAFGAGVSASTSLKVARRYFFYKYCDEDGQEKVSCHSEGQVQKYGGIGALEIAMSDHTSWFYPLGSLLFPSWVEIPESGIEIPYRRIKALVDAWLEQGSPWKPGKFARDVDAPPKGHPLEVPEHIEETDGGRQ